METVRILLVEDDAPVAMFLRAALARAGFIVDGAASVDEAEAVLRAVAYDAAVLDLRLPDGNGLDLLRRLRQARNGLPVLVLTASGAVDERVEGLDAGADDYLVKPADPAELAARLRALTRRPREVAPDTLILGNLWVSRPQRQAGIDGKVLALGRREFTVLDILVAAKGRTVAKADIEERLYGFGDEVASNSLEVHVHHLRRRLAEAGADVEIKTYRGMGYALLLRGN